jgi:hypothetical protein
MTERIQSEQVLDSNSVGDVHRETNFEMVMRVIAPTIRGLFTYLLLAAILGFCVYIMVSEGEHLASFRNAAWGVISGVAGALSTKLFGGNSIRATD